MPLGVPRSSERVSSWYSVLSFVCWASYWSHVLMMCLHVYRASSHSQLTLLLGKNCFQNSPMYVWLVQHCTRWPRTSHWFWCFVILVGCEIKTTKTFISHKIDSSEKMVDECNNRDAHGRIFQLFFSLFFSCFYHQLKYFRSKNRMKNKMKNRQKTATVSPHPPEFWKNC